MSKRRDKTPDNQKAWSETDLEARCRDYVKDAGGIAYKFTSPSRRNVPDRLVVLPAVPPFWVELKRWNATPTDGQVREAKRLLRLKQAVYFVDNLGDFQFLVDWAVAGMMAPFELVLPPGKKYRDILANFKGEKLV